ncbi:aspartate aminotransferase family protein [Kiloniella laminariae]|uniref:aspartate aminotransferase family protein n=1 Tax=Kiloniella laminariae TaxID=454162 RepID=UPI00037837C8|nr:aspartate aminotransferase family protein [Kiloniella laminariae]
MTHVFPRHTKVSLPTAVSGEGCYIIDSNGKRYLDGSGGAAVSCLGHSDQTVRQAIKDQVDELAFAHSGFFTSDPAEKLADLLIAHAPEGIDRVYFVSGGSEAVEAALKLARQYHLERGDDKRSHVIARWQSYHGNTLGALSAGGNRWRRKPFEPLLVPMTHIDPCYAYRHQLPGETLEQYAIRAADLLEAEILRVGPEKVAAFICEPVVGATMGAVAAEPGYLKRIRQICDQYGVLLILDEVMCGMGRTGSLFACDQDGVSPDILCIAKGLGAGYQPIGAMLCRDKIYQAIKDGTGFFQHGHTYMGHPVACAAGLAVITALLERNLLDKVQKQSLQLMAALTRAFGQHPFVGDIRGRGLFIGLEMVRDRETKTPFPPDLALHTKIKKIAFANGLICYPMSGTIDGQSGDHILLAPPFIIEETHITEIVDKLARTFAMIPELEQ